MSVGSIGTVTRREGGAVSRARILFGLLGLSLANAFNPAFTSRSTLGFAPSLLHLQMSPTTTRIHDRSIAKWSCAYHAEDDMVRTKKGSKKSGLWAPATSLLSWREYRQRLIKGETPYYLRRASQEKGIWVHEITQLEPGCLLIESPQHSNYATRDPSSSSRGMRVVLLVKRDGTSGLILNQPTPCSIGDLTPKLPDFADNRIYFGGDGKIGKEGNKGNTDMHTLHSVRGLKGGEELTDGVFVGADVLQAQQVVSLGLAKPEDFKFFYSCMRWEPGELEAEIAQGRWIVAASSKDVVLKPSSHWEVNWAKPMWKILLEVMGGKHALMARELYRDF